MRSGLTSDLGASIENARELRFEPTGTNLATNVQKAIEGAGSSGGTIDFPTWDPTHQGTTIALSVGNTVATFTTTSSTGTSVLSTSHQATGKWYAECKLTINPGDHSGGFGIGTILTNLTTYIGHDTQSWGIFDDYAALFHNDTNGPAVSSPPVLNSICQIAWDADTGKLWFAVDNLWVASGDPANGVNPNYTGVIGTMYLVATVSNLSNTQWTILPTNVYAPPTGFAIWRSESSGGGGTPGGTSGQVQYNNGGLFGGFTTGGDATINTGTGVLTLASTGVGAGTYGSGTVVPVITVDVKGRLTTVTTQSVPTATTSVLGLVKPDGTSITIAAGVISAVTGGSGTVTVAGAGSLTNHAVVVGDGAQVEHTIPVGTDGQLLIGQTGIDPSFKTASGDVTINATGVTAIGTNKVTNTMLAQMPAHTYKGNNTAGTANALDLTQAQLTAELNQFTTTLQGVVPGSGGGTANFLRADGSWAAPTTSQSMVPNTQSGTTYTVVDGDRAKEIIFTNSGNVAVTLPQAGAGGLFLNGWYAYFVNRGSFTTIVTITPTTSTIDGGTTFTIAMNAGLCVVSDGTNYKINPGNPLGNLMYASGPTRRLGLVPPPPLTAGTSKFLCENAVWTKVYPANSIYLPEPSGGADDSATINAALTTVGALATGGRVVLGPGQWKINTGTVSIANSHVWLEGDNMFTTMLDCTNAAINIVTIATDLFGCGIRNMGFSAKTITMNAGTAAIKVTNNDECHILNVFVDGSDNAGTTGGHVKRGIYLNATSNKNYYINIDTFRINFVDQAAIYMDASNDLTTVNTFIKNGNIGGLWTSLTAGNSTQYGIYMTATNSTTNGVGGTVEIRDTNVHGVYGIAYYCTNSNYPTSVRGSISFHCEGCGADTIGTDDYNFNNCGNKATGVKIIDCWMGGNSGSPVSFQGNGVVMAGCTGAQIIGCTAQGLGGPMVFCTDSGGNFCDNIVISGNECTWGSTVATGWGSVGNNTAAFVILNTLRFSLTGNIANNTADSSSHFQYGAYIGGSCGPGVANGNEFLCITGPYYVQARSSGGQIQVTMGEMLLASYYQGGTQSMDASKCSGSRAFVIDSTSQTFNATFAGSGGFIVPIFVDANFGNPSLQAWKVG